MCECTTSTYSSSARCHVCHTVILVYLYYYSTLVTSLGAGAHPAGTRQRAIETLVHSSLGWRRPSNPSTVNCSRPLQHRCALRRLGLRRLIILSADYRQRGDERDAYIRMRTTSRFARWRSRRASTSRSAHHRVLAGQLAMRLIPSRKSPDVIDPLSTNDSVERQPKARRRRRACTCHMAEF